MVSAFDWNIDNAEGLVSIGTHSLYVRAAGPARTQGTPAIVCIAGLGDSSVTWTAVVRHVSAFTRCYAYDRTGLGNSEVPSTFTSESKTYVNMAKELKLLLEVAEIKGPYLLVMQSMAGIPSREFLNLYNEDIAGMIFLDTLTEENYKSRPAELPGIMGAVWGGMDPSFLWTERKHRMTEEEWKDVLRSEGMGDEPLPDAVTERQRKAGGFEAENLSTSSDVLAQKQQFDKSILGDRPVCVIKGDSPGEWRRCFDRAVEAGKGTDEQRKFISDYLHTADEKHLWMQFKQLRLSRNSKLIDARESWHNVQCHQPDLVAKEVKWCLDEFAKLSSD